MDKLTVQLSQLMAQRTVLSFNFCCHKENNVNHTQKLLTTVRLIQQKDNNKSLVSARSVKQIIAHLNTEHNYSNDEVVLILSSKLILTPQIQRDLLSTLLVSEQFYFQTLSLAIARLLGDNLIFTLDFTQLKLFAGTTKPNKDMSHEGAFQSQQILFHLYYRKKVNDYLRAMVPEYKNRRERKAKHNYLSTLTWLTIDVLSDNTTDVQTLTEEFIQHDHLHSELFDVYITSLNEREITQLVNQLSVDEVYIPHIIHAMALSGYAKFIPFLAQYLQQAAYVLDAYKALRLLLGDKLDPIIPLNVQFNSDDDERKKDLSYYGAKILHAWQERLSILDLAFEQEKSDNRLLNGATLTADIVDTVLESGSQRHRYVADLHKQHTCVEPYMHHAHALEVN